MRLRLRVRIRHLSCYSIARTTCCRNNTHLPIPESVSGAVTTEATRSFLRALSDSDMWKIGKLSFLFINTLWNERPEAHRKQVRSPQVLKNS